MRYLQVGPDQTCHGCVRVLCCYAIVTLQGGFGHLQGVWRFRWFVARSSTMGWPDANLWRMKLIALSLCAKTVCMIGMILDRTMKCTKLPLAIHTLQWIILLHLNLLVEHSVCIVPTASTFKLALVHSNSLPQALCPCLTAQFCTLRAGQRLLHPWWSRRCLSHAREALL